MYFYITAILLFLGITRDAVRIILGFLSFPSSLTLFFMLNRLIRFFLERLTEIHQSYVTKQQEDASEFFIRLVNVIKVKVPQSPFVSNPIEHHFEFQMAEIQKCPK